MKQPVYLDNAATTRPDPEVLEEMISVMRDVYGNPSSVHALGRAAKTVLERSRRKVAELTGTAPSEIFFTSGGTEADNMVLRNICMLPNITTAISSAIEHHAVSHTLEEMHRDGHAELKLVHLDSKGQISLSHLEELLASSGNSLVSLMHANNEIGTMIDLEQVGDLCKRYNALFHTDAVQTMGHYPMNLSKLYVHFTNGAAHKFHGPKGVGFCYIKSGTPLDPFITGGAQERNMRAGTENIYGIAGLAKALEIAMRDYEKDSTYIRGLKNYMVGKLKDMIPGIQFNGDISDKSLYTVLNVLFPETKDSDMLLFKLDIEGVCASGGSACSSGSAVGSHVIAAILPPNTKGTAVRFSFSKFTTQEDIDRALTILAKSYVPLGAVV
jgi:cysteine desulfurase